MTVCTMSIPTRLTIAVECDEYGLAKTQDIRAALIMGIENMDEDDLRDAFRAAEDVEDEDTGGDGNADEDAYDAAEAER